MWLPTIFRAAISGSARGFRTTSISYLKEQPTENRTSESETSQAGSELVKIRRKFQNFDQLTNKEDFLTLINHLSNDITTKKRHNHVDIIYVALKSLKNVKLEKDVEIYKKILNILPKGKLIPRNLIQSEFQHYPKQQQCAVDLLEQMEDNGVIPDTEMEQILLNIFGKRGFPLRKYWRMMYWMPKFKNASPFPLDMEFLKQFPANPGYRDLQDDNQEDVYLNQLAMLTIKRIAAVDLTTQFYQKFNRITFSLAPVQVDMFNALPVEQWTFSVEGPFFTWYQHHILEYFVLKGSSIVAQEAPDRPDDDDVDQITFDTMFSQSNHSIESTESGLGTVHNQDDGIIFSCCIVALQGEITNKDDPEIDFNAGKVTLVREWIACLETEHHLNVAQKNLIFRINFQQEEQFAEEKNTSADDLKKISK